MKRSKAADLIDKIREYSAARPEEHTLALILEQHGLPRFEPCGGEAHSNAYIDNCSRCMPRWGFIGPKEPVT